MASVIGGSTALVSGAGLGCACGGLADFRGVKAKIAFGAFFTAFITVFFVTGAFLAVFAFDTLGRGIALSATGWKPATDRCSAAASQP